MEIKDSIKMQIDVLIQSEEDSKNISIGLNLNNVLEAFHRQRFTQLVQLCCFCFSQLKGGNCLSDVSGGDAVANVFLWPGNLYIHRYIFG